MRASVVEPGLFCEVLRTASQYATGSLTDSSTGMARYSSRASLAGSVARAERGSKSARVLCTYDQKAKPMSMLGIGILTYL